MRRFRLIVLLSLLALSTTGVLAHPAAAIPPTKVTIDDTDSFEVPDICSFPVTINATFVGTETTFYDQSGEVTRIQIHNVEQDVPPTLASSVVACRVLLSGCRAFAACLPPPVVRSGMELLDSCPNGSTVGGFPAFTAECAGDDIITARHKAMDSERRQIKVRQGGRGGGSDQQQRISVDSIGGIYALERIMRESNKDRWAVIDVLAAFIRPQANSETPLTIDKDTPPDEWAPVEVQTA